MSGLLAAASPVKQARPYPRRGSWRTRAPIFAATSGVPSVELLSTTRTSVTISAGRSAKTRPMDCASLCVGMTTDTRTWSWLKSPPWGGRPAPRQQCVNAPCSTGSPHRERKRCEHRNQQLPNPRRAPLRDPKTAQEQKCYQRGRARQQTEDKQDPERDLGHRLHRSRQRGVTRRQSHNCLPRGRRVTRLYVIVDQACVARLSVETLSQIFKEDPHKHCADRDTNYCQSICRGHMVGHILRWACIRHHREPRIQWMPCRFATGREELDILSGSSCSCQWMHKGICFRVARQPITITSHKPTSQY